MGTITETACENGATLVVIENGRIQNNLLIDKLKYTIGRCTSDSKPDITLFSKIAGRNHAEIINIGEDFFYVDKGSINGTYYNGKKIRKGFNGSVTPILLRNGDVLRIDSENLNNPDARGVLMMFVDEIIENEWKEYKINTVNRITIGKGAKNNIVIDSEYISDVHCKIKYIHKNFVLYDCNTQQGTYLNNNKIDSGVILHEKDKIMIGDRFLVLTGNSLIYY